MIASIKAQFTPEVQAEFHRCFHLDAESRLLSDWHAFTFEVSRAGMPFILRITHDSHRTPAEIAGELEWLALIHRLGITPLASLNSIGDRTHEVVRSGETRFTGALFNKLSGRPVGPADWNDDLFARWGELTARLHQAARSHPLAISRKVWSESDFLNFERYLPAGASELRKTARELIAEIGAHSATADNFGLMHADIYQENFFIGADGLQLFDFDNCEFGYFVNDLAIALYAALWRLGPDEDLETFSRRFLQQFLSGYRRVCDLPETELARLPLFLRLRDLTIYLVMRKKLDLKNLKPAQQKAFDEREARILGKRPVVTL